jgi:hypothetical protein
MTVKIIGYSYGQEIRQMNLKRMVEKISIFNLFLGHAVV